MKSTTDPLMGCPRISMARKTADSCNAARYGQAFACAWSGVQAVLRPAATLCFRIRKITYRGQVVSGQRYDGKTKPAIWFAWLVFG
jgi:hypothetical protein